VVLFTASTTWNANLGLYSIALSGNGYYAPNELYKTITYDENTTAVPSETNGSTVEFKNKEGQVVLKRTYGTVGTGTVNEKHDTYYVYDIYGNLTYVIPPKAADLIGTAASEADLTSTAVIALDNTLHLRATNSITLKDGFHAQSGSVFSAVIDNGSQSVLDNLCYQYKYDYRNRLVEKKLPGKQWEFIVYDKLDRPVATGPANSPFSDITSDGWLITKYDAFSRPVYTGWMNGTAATTAGRTALQSAQNDPALSVINESKQTSGSLDGIAVYYSNVVAPTSFKLLSVNYYDNYTFPGGITLPASIEGQTTLTTDQVKGLTTASWTRILTTSGVAVGETTATFYDAKARPVRIFTQNYLGGYTYTDSKLDAFSGQLQYSITRHKRTASNAELMTKDAFTYSPQDRLLTQTHQINGGAIELIANNTYDELGQLISKKVGNNIQNINYTYNIRGWLKDINNVNALTQGSDPKDLFAFKINYNLPTSSITDVKPLYNGNISETYWATNSDAGIIRSYGYRYDNLNRLKDAVFKNASALTNTYNEALIYDKNGNILSLKRNGINGGSFALIDDLTYSYAGTNRSNQLMMVADNAPAASKAVGFLDSASNAADDYSYDANGNMTKDNNKNITSIAYNHLNLPVKITFASSGNIEYIYNAAGQKVQKIVNETAKPAITTDYLGGYQYENATLKFFPTTEGYAEPLGSSYKYVYQYKDHLGNIRLSYDKNLVIQEENNYYPFGLKHEGYNNVKNGIENKYKYNGKELQDELGLNMYDFGARNYDPAIGRWMNIDPLAEKSRRFTPYTYALNNPVFFIDPDGMEVKPPDWVERADKSVYWDDNATSQSTTKSGEKYLGKEVNYTSERATTVYLHSDKTWDENSESAKTDKADTASINKQEEAGTGATTSNDNVTEDNASNTETSTNSGISAGTEFALGSGGDYYTVSGSYPLFGILNVGITFTEDRFGQSYVSGSLGLGTKGAGASFYSNYINQPNKTKASMSNFLTGWGSSVAGGNGIGFQASASGPNPISGDKSYGIGVTTPGIGASYGYTWQLN
jgi:RHS repeat-associated protein